MKIHKTAMLVVLWSVVPACGEHLVEFPLGGPGAGDDTTPPDAGPPDTGTPAGNLPTVISTNPANAATNVSINKSGGARATNVFWQVGSSATLGTTSAFQGTIMADQAITVGTGATLTGRALARIAAVTLDGNAIVKPAP
jgi:hypothetical protein